MSKCQKEIRSPYLKAGEAGGRLIRQVIRLLREQGVRLPIDAHILIAVSGGSDSVGLAHLMLHYGRKMVQPSQISLLHINHQWRGSHSDQDSLFVEALGKKWGVPVITRKVPAPLQGSGKSWEDEARRARKKVFLEESRKLGGAKVLTAHHADDLAETVLWRILTGAVETHGGGILFQSGTEMRPLLKTRKSLVRDYLLEVGQDYREDQTNSSDRFLRSRMRQVLMPEVEKLFPKGIHHLMELAARAQARQRGLTEGNDQRPLKESLIPQQALLEMSGFKPRRRHLEFIQEKMIGRKAGFGELHLPGGWKLTREETQKNSVERWILERIKR